MKRYQKILLAAPLVLFASQASAWNIQGLNLSEFPGQQLTLTCDAEGQGLECKLINANNQIIGETFAATSSIWSVIDSQAATVAEHRMETVLQLTVNTPQIDSSLVLTFNLAGDTPPDDDGQVDQIVVETGNNEIHWHGGDRGEGPPIPPSQFLGLEHTWVNMVQQGGIANGMVSMLHDSCGMDCFTHSLAFSGGNLHMSFDFNVGCGAGGTVVYAAYQVADAGLTVLLNADNGSGSFNFAANIAPFSESEIEEKCREALKSWSAGDPHPNVMETEQALLAKDVTVIARCSEDAGNTQRLVGAAVQLSCTDYDFPSP